MLLAEVLLAGRAGRGRKHLTQLISDTELFGLHNVDSSGGIVSLEWCSL